MLKALFLDMDETLCDTTGANQAAKKRLGEKAKNLLGADFDECAFTEAYIKGIYRDWSQEEKARYLPIIEEQSEGAYRVQLIRDLLAQQGFTDVTQEQAQALQDGFDADRLEALDFYPGIVEFLESARQALTLVVITNGPAFSQIPKVEAIKLKEHVDHIIIGGQEPEQKPARSIFDKALKLANCEPHEVIHVGDSLVSDIAGAHNSGITSVWVQHQQPLDAELGINPHHTVLHPSEIPELIKNLQQ